MKKPGDRELVVGIGDIHYGADINVYGLHGEVINLFNSCVFEQRMNQLFDRLTSIAYHEDVYKINVFFLGD